MRRTSKAAFRSEPFEHRHRPRQHRRHVDRQRLPGHRLLLTHLELAAPLEYLAEVQPDEGMRIVHQLDLPWLRSSDRDAELFVQLAAQRLLDRFTGFELAARKFPVAGVDLAFGA